jgi:hypothetical protein
MSKDLFGQFRQDRLHFELPQTKGCCRGSEGCVAYNGRESLTFDGIPGNVRRVGIGYEDRTRLDLGPRRSWE